LTLSFLFSLVPASIFRRGRGHIAFVDPVSACPVFLPPFFFPLLSRVRSIFLLRGHATPLPPVGGVQLCGLSLKCQTRFSKRSLSSDQVFLVSIIFGFFPATLFPSPLIILTLSPCRTSLSATWSFDEVVRSVPFEDVCSLFSDAPNLAGRFCPRTSLLSALKGTTNDFSPLRLVRPLSGR